MPLNGGSPSLQLSTALAVSGSLLVFVWYMMQKKRQQRCLPGPTTLPLVGNLIQFINNKECIPQMFNRWTDKYGPIFVIRIGQVDAIVINTMDLIREAFSVRAMVFSDRPSSLPLIKRIYQGKGICVCVFVCLLVCVCLYVCVCVRVCVTAYIVFSCHRDVGGGVQFNILLNCCLFLICSHYYHQTTHFQNMY